MENKYTKEYFSQFNIGDKIYYYNANQGLYEIGIVENKLSNGYILKGGLAPKLRAIHQLVYASVEDLKEHQLRIIQNIEQSRQ